MRRIVGEKVRTVVSLEQYFGCFLVTRFGNKSVAAASKRNQMETLLPRIWVFVVTFCLGISITAIWRIYTLPNLPEPVIEPIAEQRPVIEYPREDTLTIVGGTHLCGASAGPSVYELSDGGRISINCKNFKSRAALNRELKTKLHGTMIENWSVDTGDNGVMERRAVLDTSPTVTGLRIYGRVFCITEASSLEHLRWFEHR